MKYIDERKEHRKFIWRMVKKAGIIIVAAIIGWAILLGLLYLLFSFIKFIC